MLTPKEEIKEKRRSREGAWIEIYKHEHHQKNLKCRSREGAWIEIFGAIL